MNNFVAIVNFQGNNNITVFLRMSNLSQFANRNQSSLLVWRAWGKISAQPHTFIMHTVLCLKKTIAVTIAGICNLLALEKVYFFPSPY